jgi:hypothetical protein
MFSKYSTPLFRENSNITAFFEGMSWLSIGCAGVHATGATARAHGGQPGMEFLNGIFTRGFWA